MAIWITVDGDDIIPPALQDALAALNTLLEAIKAVTEGIQTGFEAILTPLQIFIDALDNPAKFIDDLINDLTQTRASVLYIAPQFSRRDVPGGLSKFGRTMTQAFQDNSDFERPTFDNDDVSGGIIFSINAPSFAEIATLLELFQTLFGTGWQSIIDLVKGFPGAAIPIIQPDVTGVVTALSPEAPAKSAFIDSARQILTKVDLFSGRKIQMVTGRNANRITRISTFDPQTGFFTLDPPLPANLAVGDGYIVSEFKPSRPPDWQSIPLTEVMPPLNSLVSILAVARAQLSPLSVPFGSFLRLLVQIQRILEQKILTLQLIINQIAELQTVLSNLGSLVNINVLPVSFDEGGNGRFISEFQNAGNAPPVDDDNVSVGVVIYGGVGLTATLSLLFPFAGF